MPVWVQIPPSAPIRRTSYLNRGDVAKWTKAEVCKTSIRRFESARRLQPQSSSLNSSDFVKFPDVYVRLVGNPQFRLSSPLKGESGSYCVAPN